MIQLDGSIWQAVQAISGVLALLVSLVALGVAWFYRRHDSSKKLETTIRDGDAETLKAARARQDELQETVDDIDDRVSGIAESIAEMRAERRAAITHGDLSNLHKRITQLDRGVAALVEAKETQARQLERLIDFVMELKK